jgi:hypothetical protein
MGPEFLCESVELFFEGSCYLFCPCYQFYEEFPDHRSDQSSMVQDLNRADPFGSMNGMSDEMRCEFLCGQVKVRKVSVRIRCWCDRTPVVRRDFLKKMGGELGLFPIENLNGNRQRQSYDDRQGSTTGAKISSCKKIFPHNKKQKKPEQKNFFMTYQNILFLFCGR